MKKPNPFHKLTKEEKEIERMAHLYVPTPAAEVRWIAKQIARARKDAVISVRVNSEDLKRFKAKAKKLGVPYQSIVSELIHRYSV